ncbi:MAG: hypothetical protein ACOC7S_01735 [Planctomycetota bacterium]
MAVSEKEAELAYIRQALALMGYEVFEPTCVERPDAHMRVRKQGEELRLGIEHTLYHVDAPPGAEGGSPGHRLDAFWRAVQDSLEERLLPREPQLTANVHVFLRRDEEPRFSQAEAMAGELIRLAEENLPPEKGGVEMREFSGDYPLLDGYVERVTVTNIAPAVSFRWGCADVSVSSVGVQLNHVVRAVNRKAEQCHDYDWGKVGGRWLMICAEGIPIVSGGGPYPERVEWRRDDVVAACSSSGFDRVLFYEWHYQWCQPVWPYESAYSKERDTRK